MIFINFQQLIVMHFNKIINNVLIINQININKLIIYELNVIIFGCIEHGNDILLETRTSFQHLITGVNFSN